jgi:hypothetical protein
MIAAGALPPSIVIGAVIFLLSDTAVISGAMPQARPAAVAVSTATSPFDSFIAEASQRFGIPITWISAVILQESRGDRAAVSPVGAMGLMQIMPATWTELRARYHLGANPFDPRDNILAGTAYLSELLQQFGSPAFLAAYNMGPARYSAYVEGGFALPTETQHYLAKLAPVVAEAHLLAGVETASSAAAPPSGSPLFVALSSNARPVAALPSNWSALATQPATHRASAQVEPAVASLFATSSAEDLFP